MAADIFTGFRENPADYDFESRFLQQTANSARYYITGKGVCVTEDGALFWHDIPLDEMGAFVFDEMVLNEYLDPDFTENERKELGLVRELDKQAQELGLYVVRTQDDGTHQYAIFYCRQSEAYFKVDLDQLDRVNIITANLMMQVTEPNGLDEPYPVTLDERGVIE